MAQQDAVAGQARIEVEPPVGTVGVQTRLILRPAPAVDGAVQLELRLPSGELLRLVPADQAADRCVFTPESAGDHELRWQLPTGTLVLVPYPVEAAVARGLIAAWSIPLGLLLLVLIWRRGRAADARALGE